MVAAVSARGFGPALQHVGITRTPVIGVINIFARHGRRTLKPGKMSVRSAGQPVADFRRALTRRLKGIEDSIDHGASWRCEFPVLFVAAACARRPVTCLCRGPEELRVKESRPASRSVADGLQALGIRPNPPMNGIIIEAGQISGCGQV